jgi:hypothetical protein
MQMARIRFLQPEFEERTQIGCSLCDRVLWPRPTSEALLIEDEAYALDKRV